MIEIIANIVLITLLFLLLVLTFGLLALIGWFLISLKRKKIKL